VSKQILGVGQYKKNKMMREDFPLVTLVIPAYNHAKYLKESIDSILSQDYPKIELVVINDGSTDDTEKILSNFNSQFYWETQKNIGQSRTLARGWEIAKGEILGYLSADDVLEPTAVSNSVAVLMKQPDVVATYCDFNLIDPQSRLIRRVNLTEFSYIKMFTDVSCPVGPGALFRRAAYLQAGPWNPSYRQMPDYDFWLRLGLYGKFIHLPLVLAGFRVHDGSQTYSISPTDWADEPIQIISAMFDKNVLNNINPKIFGHAMASANLVSAQLHLRSGRYRISLVCIVRAFRHSISKTFSFRMLRLLLNAIFNRLSHRILWTVRGKG
jgi:glycosyltransferase involved in cell wall biosynthesis